MKIFRRQYSSGQFTSLDESRDDDTSESQLRPYPVTAPFRDGIDASSIFRSRWTASMPCLGDMSQTDVAAESLLSSDENPMPEQPLMEDEKLVLSLMEQEKRRNEADGLVIGETPAGWIRARQVRHRMGHSVRTAKRAIKSTIVARLNNGEPKHSPISSDEDIISGNLAYGDNDDSDSVISFETEDFIKQLARNDGDARARGGSRRKRRLRILKKTVLQRVSMSSRSVQERRAVSPEQASGRTSTLSADMGMGDPYCFQY